MAHPNLYPICDLLEHVKGLVLWNNTLEIATTGGNLMIFERSCSESSMMMMYQKPEALNQANDLLQRIFSSKVDWTKDRLCDTLGLPRSLG